MTAQHTFHISVDGVLSDMIAQKAALAHKGVEEVIADLLREALERDEDVYFSRLSEQREKEAKHTVPHQEAWK